MFEKLLFFLILVYLFFRIFTRYILPWLLTTFIKKAMKNNFNFNLDNSPPKSKSNEPVVINKSKKNPNKKFDNEGEYVDFTELNDE
ncbi:MAG: hypothetical protein PHT69_15300 [Bacteroidales bacterium]|nr:hypothetical protein [Bacteroidales bacterium]